MFVGSPDKPITFQMTYCFDSTLMLALSSILNVAPQHITDAYGGSTQYHIPKVQYGLLYMDELIAICNTFHIPVSWFIVPKGQEYLKDDPLPLADELVHDNWIPIENRIKSFGTDFARAKNISMEKASEICGIVFRNFYNMFVNTSQQRWKMFSVNQSLRIINHTKVYIGQFVIDQNRPIIQLPDYNIL